MKFINAVILTYFTNFPYLLYKNANNYGNMAFAGVGLGFIHAQCLFWSSNIILLINILLNIFMNIYLHKNLNIYFNYWTFSLCIFFYCVSLLKIKYLIGFFSIN